MGVGVSVSASVSVCFSVCTCIRLWQRRRRRRCRCRGCCRWLGVARMPLCVPVCVPSRGDGVVYVGVEAPRGAEGAVLGLHSGVAGVGGRRTRGGWGSGRGRGRGTRIYTPRP